MVKRLYKSNNYNVEVGHLDEGLYRMAAYYAMPDDYSNERPVEYSFDDKGHYKITLGLDINSFMPSVDFSSEQHAGNKMFGTTRKVSDGKEIDSTQTN